METSGSATFGPSERLRVVRSEGETRILIGPGRNAWDWVAVPVVAGLCVMVVSLAIEVTSGPRPSVPALIFLCVWFAGFLFFTAGFVVSLLWRFFGTEEIVVTTETLTLTATLFTHRRSRSFALADVESVRVDEKKYRSKGHEMLRRTIAFEFAGKTEHSRSQLAKDEGESLMRGPLEEVMRRTFRGSRL